MAKTQRQEATPASAPDDVPETLGPPKSYRLYITLGFVSLILFQMILLWWMLPPRVVSQVPVGLRAGDLPNGIDDVTMIPASPIPREELLERPLREGAFVINRPRGDLNEDISITLVVLVRKNDVRKFQNQYEQRAGQISAAVLSVLAACREAEFLQVNHTTLRQRVMREVNLILESPWIQDVLVTDFQYKAI